jgi:integrase
VLLIGKSDVDPTLFISCMGQPIYPHAMSNEIGNVTEAAFGRRVCAHEFRHAAGSSIAKEDPKHVGIVPSILGHADYRTSESY